MSETKSPAKTKPYGVGLDIGTMNLVSARRGDKGIVTKRMRDVFLDLPANAKKMLKLSKTSFVEREDDVLILGDAALELANVFGKEARRPLSAGIVSATEAESLDVLGLLIKEVLGPPVVKGEACYYSVPAEPVDQPGRDIIYHREVFRRIVTECGYTPFPANEGMGIIFSETAKDGFSGVALSFGCLTPDTPIFTREGWVPIEDVREGDSVLTKTGHYGRVIKTWEKPHSGEVFKVDFYGNPLGVTLTGNHLVWVQRDGEWSWVPAEDLRQGDVVGEPVVSGYGVRKHLSLYDRDRNGQATRRILEWSSSLGRFLGYFLADGHLQSSDTNREGRYEVFVDFGPGEDSYVEDLRCLVGNLFQRKVGTTAHGNAIRCHFSHSGLHKWLKDNCYAADKTKRFPLNIEEMKPSVVEGVVVGLVRGDGWVTKDSVKFGNTSGSLITAFHLLVGRMGLTSTLTRRGPRGSTFADGREILAENCKDEWTVHVTGWDGAYLRSLVEEPSDKRSPRVWKDGGFRCTRIRSVESQPYEGVVHDLTVEGDPSFCAPYITLHNSGMTNVALAINTIEGLIFSVARGGDWIDHGAAQSVGGTQARACAAKEKGIDLTKPMNRLEEAVAHYYRAHIDYVLDQIAARFKSIEGQFDLPRAIPVIVSGGTSLAGGFMEFFNKVFEERRKRFPIEVSEIRQAAEPLNAVAHGLLIQAMQEHEVD